ncbi:hypothetical protein KBA41_02290 [Candidatus Ozemobacteraceae bacterium]|nr:hypothetical protein [Candidatus Ozemobacteraceae bacterium]
MGLTFLTPFWRSIRIDLGRYGRLLAVVTGMCLAWSGNHTPALGVSTADYHSDGTAAQNSGEFLDGPAIEMLVGGAKTPAAETVGPENRSESASQTESLNRMLDEWDAPASDEPITWKDAEDPSGDQDAVMPDADYLDLVDDSVEDAGGQSENR